MTFPFLAGCTTLIQCVLVHTRCHRHLLATHIDWLVVLCECILTRPKWDAGLRYYLTCSLFVTAALLCTSLLIHMWAICIHDCVLLCLHAHNIGVSTPACDISIASYFSLLHPLVPFNWPICGLMLFMADSAPTNV